MNAPMILTGATGFIGRRLHETLVQTGHTVRVLARPTSLGRLVTRHSTEIVSGDLEDPTALAQLCEGAAAIFHLAGATAGTPQHLRRINATGTSLLLGAAAAAAPSAPVILVSSIAAAGPAPASRPLPPDAVPAPVSFYGRSKLAGEHAAYEYADQLPITILRPGVVFGPGDREFIQLLQAIRHLRVLPAVGRADPKLALIHVDDLIAAMILAVERGQRIQKPNATATGGQGIYHIADPRPLSLAEVGRLIRPVLGRPHAPVVRLPSRVAWWGAFLAEKLWSRSAGTLNRDKVREALTVGWVVNTDSTESDLGWKPAQSLERRLRNVARNYRRSSGRPSE